MGLEAEVSAKLGEAQARKHAASAMDSVGKKRKALGLDEDAMAKKLRGTKDDAIGRMDELWKQAKTNFERSGAQVYFVDDAEKALEKIRAIVGGAGGTKIGEMVGKAGRASDNAIRIVKSKSNTCDEIEIFEIEKAKVIGGKRITLTETDTGDFIVRMLGEKETHPVLPAAHITNERIATAISKKYGKGKRVKPETKAIVDAIAQIVREAIVNADVGITGANAVTAEGNIVILENEGNISLVSRMPKKHVVLVGIEKIVPAIEDALLVARCASAWGTGQSLPSYVSIISGPSKTADVAGETVTGAQGPSELHVIVLDNGRRELAKKYSDALYCINCGACVNACPASRQVLEIFGGKMPGPKGLVSSAIGAKNGKPYLCSMCYNCKASCPALIDLPCGSTGIRSARCGRGRSRKNFTAAEVI
ncbi:MAG: LUD domain-containing protein [Candidatus Micrarchaeota archaeon]|nr:LUD domain-containing protein [Candidatus Micrarchaeota archaeon]